MKTFFNNLAAAKGARLFGAFLLLLTTALYLPAAEEAATNAPPKPPSATNDLTAEKATASEKPLSSMPSGTNAAPLVPPVDLKNIEPVPGPGALKLPGGASTPAITNAPQIIDFQVQLDLAREQRQSKSPTHAAQTLVGLLETNAPVEIKRLALYELALASQDDNKPIRAQQIFAQYIHNYPDDPSVPEVLLRQGLIYRQMGVTTMAISKFYAVMSTALKLKLENMDYYKKLVLQAQIEIADTYYLEGKYEESTDFFNRLLKAGATDLNRTEIHFKLVRALSFLNNHTETIAKAQLFLEQNTNSVEIPEVRFILASAFKKLGRNSESMKQVLVLLQSQQDNVRKNPEAWIYWQQRAGNDIANQLYKEGDYFNALQIYLSLAELDKSPAWQLPVWYQSALVYEQLQQWPKAAEMYAHILSRQKELTDANGTPSLLSLCEMAKWRGDYIDWLQKARVTNQALQPPPGPNGPAAAALSTAPTSPPIAP